MSLFRRFNTLIRNFGQAVIRIFNCLTNIKKKKLLSYSQYNDNGVCPTCSGSYVPKGIHSHVKVRQSCQNFKGTECAQMEQSNFLNFR